MQYVFLCPECDEEAGVRNLMWTMFLYRVSLPYFVCVRCCTVYYDKPLIQKIVSEFRKRHNYTKRISHREIYEAAKRRLEEVMKRRTEKMGYRFVRFRKNRNPSQVLKNLRR